MILENHYPSERTRHHYFSQIELAKLILDINIADTNPEYNLKLKSVCSFLETKFMFDNKIEISSKDEISRLKQEYHQWISSQN